MTDFNDQDNGTEKQEVKSSALKQALKFAKNGWRILPLVENSKVPAMNNWRENATCDLEHVEGFWKHATNRGYGIVTGEGSCIVLDVDVKNDLPGLDSLRELLHPGDLKDCPIIKTTSGGLHIYFKGDDVTRNAQGFMPGLDLRANGGYIVGPGTVIDGKEYEQIGGDFYSLKPMPQELVDAIQTSKKEKRKLVQRMLSEDDEGVIPEGQRNETLFHLAQSFHGDFRSPAFVLQRLVEINDKRCEPPVEITELKTIVKSVFKHRPNILAFVDKFPTTEIGLSEILLHFHEDDMIFIPEFKRFAFWNKLLWILDESLAVEQKVKFITKLFAEAVEESRYELNQAKKNGDEEAMSYWAAMLNKYSGQETKSGSRAGMKNLIEIARSEIVVNQCKLDNDDYKFAVLNGVIDLKTGHCLPQPQRDDYMTMRGLVDFDPKAECPRWLAFLETCTQGDKELQAYLKRIVGYTLTGSTREQVFFFLYGLGANGKSTFINVVQRLIGDYHRSIPSSALMVKKYGGNNGPSPELAMLRGKRLAVASELEEGERLSESLTKTLTGGDVVPARHLYGEYFEFVPKFKLFMIGNHRPHIQGGDHGIWRRIRLIPFNHSVPEGERDPYLEQKFMAELPGILNWAIEGCLEWQKEGLGLPQAVKRETEEYRDSEDIMKRFFTDCCTLDAQVGEYQKRLYEYYREWSKECKEWEMSNKAFGNKLKEQAGLQMEKRSGGNYWKGITLNYFGPDQPTSYVVGDENKAGVLIEGEEDKGAQFIL